MIPYIWGANTDTWNPVVFSDDVKILKKIFCRLMNIKTVKNSKIMVQDINGTPTCHKFDLMNGVTQYPDVVISSVMYS